ncbi:restriction endonuclease [Frankia sp. CiP3]|uniref:restriction endonuclease n=1 Tax=Frankia sp. CiP3 TaxID=2880971 RepID=UPI001EF4A039|nr:restriction endonuclease [Frankia sp. CiP3]
MGVLLQFPEYVTFRTRTNERKGKIVAVPAEPSAIEAEDLSPIEAISEAIATVHSALEGDLLSKIIEQPPVFLERLVLRLLTRMGYGGLAGDGIHLGGPHDAGLDGLIRLDTLGLDVVYVQAKRYTDQAVGRPEIQAFVGALHGAQASRGVFITTNRFTQDARTYADRVNARLVLIDGQQLARLMIEYDCGVVTQESFTLKQLDENFFGEP